MYKYLSLVLLLTLTACQYENSSSPASASVQVLSEPVQLSVSDDSVSSFTVSSYFSLYRYGPTKIFYHFTENNVVLVIDLTSELSIIQANAVIHLFAVTESADSILKWINNQHSDGLFADAPVPLMSVTLPADDVTIDSASFTEHLTGGYGDEYDVYDVVLHISDVAIQSSYLLREFSADTRVYERTHDPDSEVNSALVADEEAALGGVLGLQPNDAIFSINGFTIEQLMADPNILLELYKTQDSVQVKVKSSDNDIIIAVPQW